MRTQKQPANKLVKETKKPATTNSMLPPDLIIDIVAITPDDKTYIFEMTYAQWLGIKKKPGVKYTPYQKGFAQYPGAIRTEYKN